MSLLPYIDSVLFNSSRLKKFDQGVAFLIRKPPCPLAQADPIRLEELLSDITPILAFQV